MTWHPESPAEFNPVSCNRKLAPVVMKKNTTDRLRPVPRRPYCSSTYVSIGATCRKSECRFKGNGCFVQTGFTARLSDRLDRASAGMTALQAIEVESALIDGSFRRKTHRSADYPARVRGDGSVPRDGGRDGRRGRDLRIHVGGETPNATAASILAASAWYWQERGGGDVWTYTHSWRRIPIGAWGSISVLASTETVKDANDALAAGYQVSMVVPELPGPKVFRLKGLDVPLLPCLFETMGRTCVECRQCLDGELRRKGIGIAFGAHGYGAKALKRSLPVMNVAV